MIMALNNPTAKLLPVLLARLAIFVPPSCRIRRGVYFTIQSLFRQAIRRLLSALRSELRKTILRTIL
jgi:hypothetical protein